MVFLDILAGQTGVPNFLTKNNFRRNNLGCIKIGDFIIDILIYANSWGLRKKKNDMMKKIRHTRMDTWATLQEWWRPRDSAVSPFGCWNLKIMKPEKIEFPEEQKTSVFCRLDRGLISHKRRVYIWRPCRREWSMKDKSLVEQPQADWHCLAIHVSFLFNLNPMLNHKNELLCWNDVPAFLVSFCTWPHWINLAPSAFHCYLVTSLAY